MELDAPRVQRIWLPRRGTFLHCEWLSDFRYIWHGISLTLALVVHGTVHGSLAFRSRFLAYSGRLCYGLYIIHFFVSAYTLQYLDRGVFIPGAVYIGLSFLLAIASFRYFEMPAMKRRDLFYANGTPRTLLIFGLTFTVLVCIVGMMNLLIIGTK